MNVTLETPLGDFPGIGPARGKKLAGLGLAAAGDVLGYYPRGYEDRTRVCTIRTAPVETPVCIVAMVAEEPRLSRVRKGLEFVKVKVVDTTGRMDITFFNQGYLKKALQLGETYVFYGVAEGGGGLRRMTNPTVERVGQNAVTACIMPIYPLTAGISNKLLAGLSRRVLEACADSLPENLPLEIRQKHKLAGAVFSCRSIHFPTTFEELELARRRLQFEELFFLSVGLALLKSRRGAAHGVRFCPTEAAAFDTLLPFQLTSAQKRAMAEVAADCTSGRPMNRLVQGDVGSGKTVVAAYGAWLAWGSGYQAAMMAPTEILAQQHFESLTALLAPTGMTVGLLTGSLKAAEKKRVYASLTAGELDLVIGTHALLTETVAFHRLGLVIADEQHRFGVAQRAALSAKATASGGRTPHVLVMSATPIPRTLALVVYGDLDVSVIDELPPGRSPVKTFLVGEDKRQRMYDFVRKLVGEGRQAYIVCPAVEESDQDEGGTDLKTVLAYAGKLQTEVFPALRVGLIHGKLKPREKEQVMEDFSRGNLDVLVSTTVIEVGVDVPNAALMIVENAERFGLSQLHQLRGRVGRGAHQSYCILVTATRASETRERLKTLCATTDGFKIAEKDLQYRGPGDFFGGRQHGLPTLRLADLVGDMRLLQEAQDAARELLTADPALTLPQHRPVMERVRGLFVANPDIFN